MTRKDCDNFMGRGRPGRHAWMARLGLAMVSCAASAAHAGQLRLWATAVVVNDSIKLGDLAEVRGLDGQEEHSLRHLKIADAPPPGGSRIIHHAMIRTVLQGSGFNLASLSVIGASQCEVRRPAIPQQPQSAPVVPITGGARKGTERASGEAMEQMTLRQEIERYFDRELAKFGGKAELLFDRDDAQVLELTSPPMEFAIHREKGLPLGLCALQVEVGQAGKAAQRIPVVVRAALSRNVVAARRAINQGATITAADVDLMGVNFARLEDLGIDDLGLVLGQRAKRFIAAGATVELEMLEEVPLVLRGQLITLVSEVGGVRVVTTAKAAANGMRGQTIRVRIVDDSKAEIDAVVVGPGEVRAVGSSPSVEDSRPRLVLGGSP